ncbi:MAG TPA: hypothetical protein VGW78_02725 [Candidatus Babeliales bacterium]|jgi:hypothetical protein|nr:hypothetical protein [Candidatus Babeliales bacterium]
MIKKKKNIILICTPLRFYTNIDEDLFFQWLDAISCIQEIKGIARELHLYITSDSILNEDLLNLIGLFERYKFDKQQLLVFKNKQNREWFND